MRVEANDSAASAEDGTPGAAAGRPGQRGRGWLWALAFALLVGLVVARGIRPRLRASADLQAATAATATPDVAVVRPQFEAATRELVIPANLAAYTDSPIYARTSGYLKSWTADIGAHVRAGELLAVIDTPEVDQQLDQAKADLATAQANLALSKITDTRYQGLLGQDGVSQQDADNAQGDLAAKTSMVTSAQANVTRLTDLQGFDQVVAPFAGVITARNVDIGALIDAGGGARELFHIEATDRLRVYANLPQDDAGVAKPGLRAALELAQYPGERFPATLTSTASSIDPASRTLLSEFLVNNPAGRLLPGAYGELHIAVATPRSVFLVPVSAMLFRAEGPRLVVVANGRAELRKVTVGRDYGANLEIVSGLDGDEAIVTNPPDSVVDGEALRITGAPAGAAAPPAAPSPIGASRTGGA